MVHINLKYYLPDKYKIKLLAAVRILAAILRGCIVPQTGRTGVAERFCYAYIKLLKFLLRIPTLGI